MAYPILGTPKPAFFATDGTPLASGTITILNPSDDAVKASYPTADDADASTNGTSGDITLDSRGEPTSTQLWGKDGEDYKLVIKDSAGSTVYTLDDIRMPEHSRRAAVSFSASDATPSVAESNVFRTTDGTTLTDFDDGQVGDVIHIQNTGTACTLTNSGFLILAGAKDFTMRGADTITLAMFGDQLWHEIGRSVNNAEFETVTTTNTILANESGKTFFLNLAGGFTSTLPAPAEGLKFKFIVQTAPTTAYIITTNGGDNIIFGTIVDTTATLAANAEDTITFVASTALVGDSAEFISDGTNWYMTAQSQANGGITATAT